MPERLRVFGEDALAQALRQRGGDPGRPLFLVTDLGRLEEACSLLPPGGVLGVTAFSPGARWLRREGRLSVPAATFGSLVPLSDPGPVDLALPPDLSPEERAAWSRAFASVLGPVERVDDTPGLVAARILAGIVNEAAHLLGEGGAPAEVIDRALVLGLNFPRGPLLWADRIGLDRIEDLLLALSHAYGPELYRPAPLLSRLVAGRKTGVLAGEGFYSHPER